MNITFYTDGSSRGNPGPGGWGVYVEVLKNEIVAGRNVKKLFTTKMSGGEKLTTNNKMELLAGIEALKYLKKNLTKITSPQSNRNSKLNIAPSQSNRNSKLKITPSQSNRNSKLKITPSQSNRNSKLNLAPPQSPQRGEETQLQITIKTDSMYMKNGIETWIKNWEKNNWKGSNKKEVMNKECWQELLELKNFINKKLIAKDFSEIKFEYVKAHVGIMGNEIADTLATKAADKFK